MKRKNTSAIELARAKVQNLEAELGEWCGSQTVPAPASAHLAYLVRVGEIEKARAALRRLELKSKRINRQLAQPELFDSTTPAAARDGAG